MLVKITRECLIEGKLYKKGQQVEVKKFVPICMEKVVQQEKKLDKKETKKTKKGAKK